MPFENGRGIRPVAIEVVAGLIYRENHLLACQRRKGGAFPLKWEFPGGKVEPGETYLGALQRELKEELEIEVLSATEVFRYKHSYSNQMEVDLLFFRVNHYQGAVANRVFHQLLWVAPRELKDLDFLEGDRPLIEKLVSRGLRL
ncbi:MAG: (deoxy)nucleoside triphosphate pyrophosphohydrolase [Candidatus Binatia bacterium]